MWVRAYSTAAAGVGWLSSIARCRWYGSGLGCGPEARKAAFARHHASALERSPASMSDTISASRADRSRFDAS